MVSKLLFFAFFRFFLRDVSHYRDEYTGIFIMNYRYFEIFVIFRKILAFVEDFLSVFENVDKRYGIHDSHDMVAENVGSGGKTYHFQRRFVKLLYFEFLVYDDYSVGSIAEYIIGKSL